MYSHVLQSSSFLNVPSIILVLIIKSTYSATCQPNSYALNKPGGYALRTPDISCPAGSHNCSSGAQTRCCPSNTTCLVTDSAFCCEGNENCIASLAESPRCPTADWSLWSKTNTFDPNNMWCCEPGLFGLLTPIGEDQMGLKCKTYGDALEQDEIAATHVPTIPCAEDKSLSIGKSDALSIGAIVGITIGALIAIITLVGGLLIWRKGRENNKTDQMNAQRGVPDVISAQIDGHEILRYKHTNEAQHDRNSANFLDGNVVHELEVGQTLEE